MMYILLIYFDVYLVNIYSHHRAMRRVALQFLCEKSEIERTSKSQEQQSGVSSGFVIDSLLNEAMALVIGKGSDDPSNITKSAAIEYPDPAYQLYLERCEDMTRASPSNEIMCSSEVNSDGLVTTLGIRSHVMSVIESDIRTLSLLENDEQWIHLLGTQGTDILLAVAVSRFLVLEFSKEVYQCNQI